MEGQHLLSVEKMNLAPMFKSSGKNLLGPVSHGAFLSEPSLWPGVMRDIRK